MMRWLFLISILHAGYAHPCPPIPEIRGEIAEDISNQHAKRNEILRCHIDELVTRRKRIIDDFRKAVLEKGEEKRGKDRVALAVTRSTLRQVLEHVDRYASACSVFHSELQTFHDHITRHYLPEARTRTEELKRLAAQAPSLDLGTIPRAVTETVRLVTAERDQDSSLLVRTRRLIADFGRIENAVDAALSEHSEFLLSQDMKRPRLLGGELPYLRDIAAVVEKNLREFSDSAGALLREFRRKESFLGRKVVDETVLAHRNEVATLDASADFSRSLTQRLRDLRSEPEKGRHGLPLLEADYLRKREFAAIESVCQATEAAWARSGCLAVGPSFRSVRVYLERTLPRHLRSNLDALTEKKVAGLGPLREAIDKADWTAAVRENDLLVRGRRP